MIVCSKCNRTISSESLFCPLCGHAVFKESVVYNSTTAEFDPSAPDRKPWRDKPLVPVRNYVIRNKTNQPWYPAMRQKQRVKERKKKDMLVDQEPVLDDDHSVASTDMLSSVGQSSVGISIHDQENDIEATIEDKFVREKIFPLVTYDLPTNSTDKYYLIVSLVEQTYGVTSSRLCWLRLALIQEDSGDDGEEENSSVHTTTILVDYIPNHFGKLLKPKDQEWIDLFALKSIEEKKSEASQTHRVYQVFLETKRSKHGIPEEILQNLQVLSSGFLDQVQLRMNYQESLALKVGNRSDFHYDPRTAPIAGRIRLSRNYEIPYCNAEISVKLHFGKRFGAELEQNSLATLRAISSNQEFHETGQVTGLDILIVPGPSNTEVSEASITLPTAEVHLDIAAVEYLLKDSQSSNNIEEILRESMEDAQVFDHFLLSLMGMFRLEYTEDGVHYTAAGAFTHPTFTSFPWPKEINCDCDEADLAVEEDL